MKVVILAGGRGTRLSEETQAIPKPMVEIGGKPILWHIMKTYSYYGFNDFIVCLGYRAYIIKEYFSHYFLHMSDITIDMESNAVKIHTTTSEPWKVTLVDTGLDTMTGGRLKRVQKYVGRGTFLMTYGDGVADVNLKELVAFHRRCGSTATVTAVQPLGRFGSLDISSSGKVRQFLEKPKGDNTWINAGYFVLEHGVFSTIRDDRTIWEREPMEHLANHSMMSAYRHKGFWKPMDTLRDKTELEELWLSNKAPWKLWEN